MDLEFPTLDLDAPMDDNLELDTQAADDNLELGNEADSEVSTGDDNPAEPAEGEEETLTDGRKLPDEVRKALKALRDSSPENAKAARALNDVYGREQAYKQVFPSVKDAQAAQGTIQTIESFGGLDAVQSTIAEIEEVDRMLRDGDPKAIDKILEVSGEGFGKIAPAMLDKLQASNPDAYAATIRPHLVTAIGQSGLNEAVAAVLNNFDLANTPGATGEFKAKFEKQAVEGLTRIQQYLHGLKSAEQPKAPTGTGAPDDKLSAREQAVAQQEDKIFRESVGNHANTEITNSLAKALTPYLRGVKIDQVTRGRFTQAVYDQVAELVKADKVYQTTKDNLFKAKNKDAANIANHMKAKFSAVVGDAAKTVAGRAEWKAVLGTKGAPGAGAPKAGAPPAPGGLGTAEKPILVKELPARTEIDWDKTDDEMTMRGIRVLKSGKVVRLNR